MWRWQSICIDSTDPVPLARWWAELLGWRITCCILRAREPGARSSP